MSFRKKLINSQAIPLLFEIVPPKKEISQSELDSFINTIVNIVKETKIDALDIPDLIKEKAITRKKPWEKMPPRNLAKLINQKSKTPIIVNRVTIFDDLKKQKKWLIEADKNYQAKYLILVGAPDDKPYSGLSVVQMAKLVNQLNKKNLTSFYYGAITIPSRRCQKNVDEPQRMISKQKAGVSFFLSQIIFEAKTVTQLLEDYYQACKKKGIKPKRIFLSFAPVSTSRDLEFLKSLQVFIPLAKEKILVKNQEKMAEHSISMIRKTLANIFVFCQKQKLEIPLGINVCYIRKQNLATTKKLLKLIAEDRKTF